jgi:hypothetical protein
VTASQPPLPHRTRGEALDRAMMKYPAPVREPLPSPGRDRIVSLLERLLRGPDAPKARALILHAVDDHAAAMVELYARPDDRWEPS